MPLPAAAPRGELWLRLPPLPLPALLPLPLPVAVPRGDEYERPRLLPLAGPLLLQGLPPPLP